MRFSLLILLTALPAALSAQADRSRVTVIPRDQVSSAFAQGKPLVEVGDYKVHASRREGPGMAEIHTRDTDIAYVLQGSAELVTGGTAVAVKSTGPEELRGTAIEGGQTRELVPGDVVVIPNGVPHWFKEVKAPFLYYVVKVRQAEGQTTAAAAVDLPTGLPQAVVDLRTAAGAALVRAQWRYRDATIVEADHRDPGPDLRPSGAPNRTNDISPQAGAADFDDSSWEVIEPAALEDRRSRGKLAFNWYRTRITLPQRVGDLDVRGATVVLELVLDDYAEIWVDGRLPLVLGQTGGHLIKGFNAPNRVVLTRDARPGQKIQLAIFGANGPLSRPPANFIWVRSATLDFFPGGTVNAHQAADAKVVRLDPALDRIVSPGTRIEKLAGGFQFTEGPVWHPDGYLLFSDPNANTIYRWSAEGAVSVFRTKSGYSGFDIGRYRQPGSNGLTLDREGLLTINEHGNRRVTRLERTGKITVLADRYRGKRLNSPNDLVYRSDGVLYFTDPPFGLPKVFDDPDKELPFSGVYMLKNGELTLLTRELSGPNGIAFSPDEKYLYVGNWDLERKVLMRYPVEDDGRLGKGAVFYDFTSEAEPVALDGIKVDIEGNVYVSAPGGVWILSSAGKPLGRILPPEHDANFAFGDGDGKSLYLTASTGLYRIQVNVPGIRASVGVQAASR